MKAATRLRIGAAAAMLLLATVFAVTAFAATGGEEQPLVTQGYLLMAHGGYVAIYDAQSGTAPSIITAIELKMLTEADRALMEVGLPARNEEELAMLLEDLNS